ncbi:GIY-YIG nuclease family protein [Ilyomonas limi]|uniref:GIY-YIG nuclease family protein n=1 Tax=Ilyomonas limi TaxID=2575867 RepID=A0A4U3KZG5_9BACT|nr:GIY-YIG nuclease family protein [Ilyomonas limi]TKK68065.1 GIY-YIG nuclease family protein [Ilyomonas limi]
MAKTLDDIFNDDDFGLLNSKEKSSNVKTDEDRLVDSFEEINTFFEKNNREPSTGSMSEYNLLARLKGFRNDDKKKKILKPFDRFNLLGYVEMEKKTFDEILEDDDLGLLNTDGDTSIFNFKHTPKQDKRAETDFVAQRQPMPEEEFSKYELMFQQVHKEIKEGKRKLLRFDNIEQNLHIGNYYLIDGVMLYLESAELETEYKNLKSGGRVRKDGRTITIFENATKSNMLYRSLGKMIQKSGKLITQSDGAIQYNLIERANQVSEDDLQSGWIYVLKSKSQNLEISAIRDLYKIGFSTMQVADRIKNASREATFLFADVDIVATYHCYNLNMHLFENLIHRFFGESCLNIDLYNDQQQRITPREWFVVPLPMINEAINLLTKGIIINYRYDKEKQQILLK